MSKYITLLRCCATIIVTTLVMFNLRFYFRENNEISYAIKQQQTEIKNKFLEARPSATIDEWEKKRDDMFNHFIIPKYQRCRFHDWDRKDKLKHKLDMKGTKTVNESRRRLIENQMKKDTDADQPFIRRRLRNERDICYIHIGKTAGTTIDCNLRIVARLHLCRHRNFTESGAISPQTTCRWHLHQPYLGKRNKRKFENYRSFIFSIRNPIHRIISSYFYDYNKLTNENKTGITCGMVMIFSCYTQMNDLASLGLDGPRPPLPFKYPVRTDLTQEECKGWAWGFVQGTAAAWKHNYFNYDYYTKPILPHATNEIFVIRAEHLWDDWKAIDYLVGGEGELPIGWNESLNVNQRVENKDKAISSDGMSNLCHALCDEIQIYKQLLSRAVNLSPGDVEESLLELKMVCPKEGSIVPHNCTY